MTTGNTLEQEAIAFVELDELDKQLNELMVISETLNARLKRVLKNPTTDKEIGIPDSRSIGSSELAIRISAQSISAAKIANLLSSIIYRLEV